MRPISSMEQPAGTLVDIDAALGVKPKPETLTVLPKSTREFGPPGNHHARSESTPPIRRRIGQYEIPCRNSAAWVSSIVPGNWVCIGWSR